MNKLTVATVEQPTLKVFDLHQADLQVLPV